MLNIPYTEEGLQVDAKQCSRCGECYHAETRVCPACGSSEYRDIQGFRPAGPTLRAGAAASGAGPHAPPPNPDEVRAGGIGCALRAAAAGVAAAMAVSFFTAWGQSSPAAVTYGKLGDALARDLSALRHTLGAGVLAVFVPVLAATYAAVAALGGSQYRRRAIFLVLVGVLGLGSAWQIRTYLLAGAFGNATRVTGLGFEIFVTAAFVALLVGVWGVFAEVDAKAPGRPAPEPAASPRVTGPDSEIPLDLSANDLLQQAHWHETGASPKEPQKAAIYYQVYIARYPDHHRVAWARERLRAIREQRL